MQNMKVENLKCPFILWGNCGNFSPKNREFVAEYSFSKILFTRRQKFATNFFVVLMPWCLHQFYLILNISAIQVISSTLYTTMCVH